MNNYFSNKKIEYTDVLTFVVSLLILALGVVLIIFSPQQLKDFFVCDDVLVQKKVATTTTTIKKTSTSSTSIDGQIIVNKSNTTRVCQVIGDEDWETKKATLGQVGTKYGADGTDLGGSFVFGDDLYFLFGDTNTLPKRKMIRTNPKIVKSNYDDALAYVPLKDINNQECLKLSFETEKTTDGRDIFAPPIVDGGDVGGGGFQVPMSGFEYDDEMYVFFSALNTNRFDSTYAEIVEGGEQKLGVGRSVLAKKTGIGTFDYLYDFSVYTYNGEHYPNTQPGFTGINSILVDSSELDGLPKKGKGILVFGVGYYRFSKIYLAYINLEDIEKREKESNGRYSPKIVYYYAGLDSNDEPIWKSDWENHNKNAVSLFDLYDKQGNPAHYIDSASVAYSSSTGYYYMTYDTASPDLGYNPVTSTNVHEFENIHFRYAKVPWIWSSKQIIFQPQDYYGTFIYKKGIGTQLTDPPAGILSHKREDEIGGSYAPSMIPQKFKYNATTKQEDIYYLLSTHNPYTVVLMKTTIKIK